MKNVNLSTKGKIIIITSISVFAGLAYWLYKTGKIYSWFGVLNPETTSESTPSTPSKTNIFIDPKKVVGLPATIQESVFPIVRNTQSKQVLWLQITLNKLFNAGLVEDGIYGQNTYSAISYYVDGSDNYLDTITGDIKGISNVAKFNGIVAFLQSQANKMNITI